eukprot:4472598-Ditylum_brightwellii.AAC.1
MDDDSSSAEEKVAEVACGESSTCGSANSNNEVDDENNTDNVTEKEVGRIDVSSSSSVKEQTAAHLMV